MSILYPQPRTEIFVPRGLDGRVGHAVLEATHREPDSQIHWHLDDTFVGTTQGFHQISLAPSPGPHLLTLVDETGTRRSTSFSVLDPN
jgi:penicillin-binding protein 1C